MSREIAFVPPYAQMPAQCCVPDKMSIFNHLRIRNMRRLLGVFEWKVPRSWDKDYFLWNLFGIGYCAVVYTNTFGLIPQRCSLTGVGMYETPTEISVSNQFVNIPERKIGDMCVLFRVRPDYLGMWDVVDFYSLLMAEAYSAYFVNLSNSKVAYVFTANDKKEAETLKKLVDKVDAGETAVFMKARFGSSWDTFTQNVKQNFIGTELLENIRKIYDDFDSAIGIKNCNTEKKERQLVDEINSNNEETLIDMSAVLERLHLQCEEAEKVFGTKVIEVDWRFKNGNSTQISNIESGL